MAKIDPNKLHVCHGPDGTRHEVTWPNYQDLVHQYGFTPGAPASGDAPTESAPNEAVEVEADADEAADADADEASEDEDEAEASEAVDFGSADKPTLVAYLNANYPEATFDGRASRDTLAELATSLSAEAAAASDA